MSQAANRAAALMVQGTMSNVGKSVVAAGLCRVFWQDGARVAPFKSQNMALNSFITREGLEMGRAQVLQAAAAGVEPQVRMNPILLKPTNDTGSQVIVNGEVAGQMSAAAYYDYKKQLRPVVQAAYDSLSADFDVIVLEGAGSPAEINLKADDIVNMGMAAMADCPVLLVADIDRGGVFGSVLGTLALLEPEERARVKGVIINKFRGDAAILQPGLRQLTQRTGVPVLGVLPFLPLDLEEEDSLSIRLEQTGPQPDRPLDVAVVRLPRISNFTDFDALARHPAVGLRFVQTPQQLKSPDLVLLPGSKNTMEDLLWMRQNGLEAAVLKLAAADTPVVGVCGGYQMLGQALHDPEGVERGGSLRGMGLLPVETVFAKQKTRTRASGTVLPLQGLFAPLTGTLFAGYEIHMGQTLRAAPAQPFATLQSQGAGSDPRLDGAVCGNCFGCYLHGLFDEALGQQLVALLLQKKGITSEEQGVPRTAAQHREQQLDLLAAAVRQHLDMPAIYRILRGELTDTPALQNAPGLLHYYYGDGKGKTTAALGLALRALGHGRRVVMVQFLKGAPSGELRGLEPWQHTGLLTLLRGKAGAGFASAMRDEERRQTTALHNENLRRALALAKAGGALLILDEATDALALGMLDAALFEQATLRRPAGVEVVVTGHRPLPQLAAAADYLTEMKKHRHPYDKGVTAREGIEF